MKAFTATVLGLTTVLTSLALQADVVWQGHCRDRSPTIISTPGNCSGPGGDVINIAIERLGHRIEWTDVPWARTINAAENGGVDIIPLHSMTEDREAFLYPINMGYDERILQFFKRKEHDINVTNYDELQKLSIGALRGSFYSQAFNKNLDILNVHLLNNTEQLINMLKAGRIDIAVTSPIHDVSIFIDDPELTPVEYQQAHLNGRYFSVPMKSDKFQYVSELKSIVENMLTSGEISKIFESYNLEPPLIN